MLLIVEYFTSQPENTIVIPFSDSSILVVFDKRNTVEVIEKDCNPTPFELVAEIASKGDLERNVSVTECVESAYEVNRFKTDIVCSLVDVIEINNEFAYIIVSDYIGVTYYVTITLNDIEFDPNRYTYYRIRGEYIDSMFEGFSNNFMKIYANSIDFINEFYADSLANEIYALNLPVG